MDNTNKTPQQLAEEKTAQESNHEKVEAKSEPKTEEKPPVTEPAKS